MIKFTEINKLAKGLIDRGISFTYTVEGWLTA